MIGLKHFSQPPTSPNRLSHASPTPGLKSSERFGSLWGSECFFSEGFVDVSKNRGFSTQIIHFNRVVPYKPYKPSILVDLCFWKHPCITKAFKVPKMEGF